MVKRAAWLAAVFATLACAADSGPVRHDNLEAALGAGWRDLPDWRGVWFLEGPLLFGGPENAMVPPGATAAPRLIRGVEFTHGVPAGAYVMRIPYRPEFQRRYDERVKQDRERGQSPDPVEDCRLGYGMPRLMGAGPGAVQFHLTPQQSWIIWDYRNQVRRIPTDGGAAPTADAPASPMGHSVGHWEGRTLVIRTTGLAAGQLDRSGAPHSDQLRLTERITRTDADTLTVAMTLEDPLAFTGAWQVTRRFKRSLEPFQNLTGTFCTGAAPTDGGSAP